MNWGAYLYIHEFCEHDDDEENDAERAGKVLVLSRSSIFMAQASRTTRCEHDDDEENDAVRAGKVLVLSRSSIYGASITHYAYMRTRR